MSEDNGNTVCRKLRILQFPIANSYGGITHYALNNWKWMDKTKFRCDFATMSKKLDFAEELEEQGCKIHYISCYAEEDKEQFIKEVNVILDEGYDIVHLHTKQWKSFIMEQICVERKVPKIIVHSHSTQCDANDAEVRAYETEEHFRVRKQFSESLATDFWACSLAAADWLFGTTIPEKRIHIIKNAIDVNQFIYNSKIRKQLRSKYGITDKIVVGNVGRLVYPKNQRFLIDVYAKVCETRNDLMLLIIGDGELREELEKHALETGVSQSVLFLGKKSNLNELYQMMDLFVLPSNFEGLPITLIEAQASGLKCLVSDKVTTEATITKEVEYLPLEIDVWAGAIERSSQLSCDRERNSRLVLHSDYNIETYIKKLEAAYSGQEDF